MEKRRNLNYYNLFIIFFLLINFSSFGQTNNLFYYYKGDRIHLKPDPDVIAISLRSEKGLDDLRAALKNGETMQNTAENNIWPLLEDVRAEGYGMDKFYYTEIKFSNPLTKESLKETIKKFETIPSVLMVSQTLVLSDGGKMGISNNFYVKLNHASEYQKLQDLAKKYNIRILGRDRFMPLWHVLSCDQNSDLNSIQAANYFYETGLFDSAVPEFMIRGVLASAMTPSDPYFSDQWYLWNTGQGGGLVGMDINIVPVWSITKGENIKIAIFDTGFEMNHPDLSANVLGSGYNTWTASAPSITYDKHGTAVAGIAGAEQNNIGITGVAPEASLISISYDWQSTFSWQRLTSGINWAVSNGVDIINNSWAVGGSPNPMFDNAISNAFQNGRNGKGTIVVFSSGNNNSPTSIYPSNSNPLILNVGGVDRCGIRSGQSAYITEATACDPWPVDPSLMASSYGPTLDVVAGGSRISTTDRQGNMGYNPDSTWAFDYTNLDYTRYFAGTSAAAPQVAGLAALILSMNPNLSVLEVNNIIEQTAQKIRTDVYTYSTTGGRPNGSWNQYLGYGMIDACRAVYAAYASTNPISGPDYICVSGVYSVANLPSGATVTGWSADPSALVNISGSGTSVTVSKVGPYTPDPRPVTLSATLSTDCGPITIQRQVSIGTINPNITDINISGGPGHEGYFCALALGFNSYELVLNPSGPTAGPFVLELLSYPGGAVLYSQEVNLATGSLPFTADVGTYTLRARGLHPCGPDDWKSVQVQFVNCN